MFTKTFGVISLVISKEKGVSPFLVSTQYVWITRLPFSMLTSARPISLPGILMIAFSPIEYVGLSELKDNIVAPWLAFLERPAHPGQSIYTILPVECPDTGS